MFTRAIRTQFELKDGVFVHEPTQAEFTPHPDREDSFLVWTGNIGVRLPGGELYEYADVLAMMKTIWREIFLSRSPQRLVDA
jgi:hypothetical protein